VGDWRVCEDGESVARAVNFDARVAAALAVAIEGHVPAAEKLLAKIRIDILGERAATASVKYVMWAVAATGVAVLIACIFTSTQYKLVFEYSAAGEALWAGVGAGALGAFFSIAIAARSRKILTNIQRRLENAMDAIVRITIGAIAGMLFAGLLQAKLISFSIGGVSTGQSGGWMLIAFGAFVAGFSERLIPNLLDRTATTANGVSTTLPESTVSVSQEVHDTALTLSIPESEYLVWPGIETGITADGAITGLTSADQKRRRNRPRPHKVNQRPNDGSPNQGE
jgi:hypothetical protein